MPPMQWQDRKALSGSNRDSRLLSDSASASSSGFSLDDERSASPILCARIALATARVLHVGIGMQRDLRVPTTQRAKPDST